MSLRDIIKARASKQADKFDPNVHVVRARTVGIDYASSPAVANRPNYIWVMEYNIPGGYHQVFNAGVPDMVNLPVLVYQYPKEPYIRQAKSVDWSNLQNLVWGEGGAAGSGGSAHHTQHEWQDWNPGYDVVNVHIRNIVPLRGFPSDDLTVYIDHCRYHYDGAVKYFAGDTFDWTAYANSSILNTTFILVYLDMQSNTIKAVSNTVSTSSIGSNPIPHYPTIPNYALPSCVIMHNDQTATVETMITDVRDLYVYEDSRVYEWLDDIQGDLYALQSDIYDLYTGNSERARLAMVYDSTDEAYTELMYDDTWTLMYWNDVYATILQDNLNGFDAASDRYVVKQDGYYQLSATVDASFTDLYLSSEDIKVFVGMYINGSLQPYIWKYVEIVYGFMLPLIAFPVELNYGDYFQIYVKVISTQAPLTMEYRLVWNGYRI